MSLNTDNESTTAELRCCCCCQNRTVVPEGWNGGTRIVGGKGVERRKRTIMPPEKEPDGHRTQDTVKRLLLYSIDKTYIYSLFVPRIQAASA
jgi:hypothetical protein